MPAARAVADLYVAVILLGAVGARIGLAGVGDRINALETAAFLVAGVAVGYAGLAGLAVVPAVAIASTVGNFAIVAAIGLLLYRRQTERRAP